MRFSAALQLFRQNIRDALAGVTVPVGVRGASHGCVGCLIIQQAAEILMNYCTSMGKYFADQSAIDTLMDVAIDSQNSVDEQAAEIIPDLAEGAGVATGETNDEFLKGFHESTEYAAALVAYRNRIETENSILEETDAETPEK